MLEQNNAKQKKQRAIRSIGVVNRCACIYCSQNRIPILSFILISNRSLKLYNQIKIIHKNSPKHVDV